MITGLGVGGAEMMLVKLLAGTDRERFESEVISLSSELALADRIRAAGVTVSTLDIKPSLLRGAMSLPALRRRLASFGPDLVQTWMYHADLAGGLVARSIRTPAIWNVQAGNVDPEHIPLRTRGLVRLCGAVSGIVPRRVVSCSWAAIGIHEKSGYPRSKFVVIPNGTDLRQFGPDPAARAAFRAEFGLPADSRIIGMVARLHAQKDHPTLFRAFADVVRTHPDVRLVLCGLGLEPANAELAAMLGELGIARNVLLLGVRSDVPRVLAALDLHVLPSAFGEGFPNVLGEAMACGLPCVVTDVGDSALIVGDTGVVIPPRDAGALAAALRQMLDLPEAEFESLRRRARERVATQFSLPQSIRAYEALYEEVSATTRDVPRSPASP